jgi:hypothetical protein
MSENMVIELRNKDNLQPHKSFGEWTTRLNESVQLFEGDSILTRNVFVDTKSQSGPSTDEKIPIPETLELFMDFYLYNMNWEGAKNNPGGTNVDVSNSAIRPLVPPNTEGAGAVKNDGNVYVGCEVKDLSGNTDVTSLQNFLVVAQDVLGWGIQQNAFQIAFWYTNTDGVAEYKVTEIPGAPLPGQEILQSFQMFSLPCNVLYKKDTNPAIPIGNQDYITTGAPATQDGPIGIYIVQGYNANGVPRINFGKRMDALKKQPYTLGNLTTAYQNILFPLFGQVVPEPATPINTEQNVQVFGNPVKGTLYEPFLQTVKVELAGGPGVNYDPTDLAEEINRQFTAIPPESITNTELSGSNKFLRRVGYGAPGGDPSSDLAFIEATIDASGSDPSGGTVGVFGYKYNTNTEAGARYVGASQISLAYNPDKQRFSFDFLHSPLYQGGGGAVTVGLVFAQQFPSSDNKTFPVLKAGGILIKNLYARVKETQQPTDFWGRTLGFGVKNVTAGGKIKFDLGNILVKPSIISSVADPSGNPTDTLVNGVPASIPVFPDALINGVNMTGGFFSLDNVVQKGDKDSTYPSFQPPELDPSNANVFSSSDKQYEIEANRSITNSATALPFAYYLLSINANFKTNLLTENRNMGTITSIISRYYTNLSYTSGSASDAVIYTHRGPPTLLSSFDCRILNSDKDLAPNIGSDNTVFIEIVRAPKPNPLLALPPAEQKEILEGEKAPDKK